MTITIGNYTFEGPYSNFASLLDRSGIYVILCLKDGKRLVIDVGESATVKSRVEGHDRAPCWRKHCAGTLEVAVYYTPNTQQPGRMQIEQELRKLYQPPCGDR